MAIIVTTTADSGSQHLYSFRDILPIKIIKSLLDTEISLQNVRKALAHLKKGVTDLSDLTLMSDSTTAYECSSADEIVDLPNGSQGVFGDSHTRLGHGAERYYYYRVSLPTIR